MYTIQSEQCDARNQRHNLKILCSLVPFCHGRRNKHEKFNFLSEWKVAVLVDTICFCCMTENRNWCVCVCI